MSRPALLLACLLLMWTASVDAAEDGPGRFLPPEGALPGLKTEGAARTFRGEQLYDHLNGGAEIFMEYGFRAAVTQDLVDERGRGFVLEIFEMEDDAAAYGLFTYYRTSGGDVPALGDAAHLADYYLGLWSGRHVAIVTSQGGGGEDAASVLRLVGRAVADRIPGGGILPRLPSLLPGGNRAPGSEKYFEGGLGFLNSVDFFVGDVFGARRGAKAAFPGGYDVFLLEYERPQESLRAFSRAEGALKEQEGFQDLSDSAGPRFQVAREDGKAAVVSLHGASVLGAVSRRPDSLPAAMAALEETRRTLEKDETAPAAAVRERKWRLGFSERGRFDSWDNVETLDQERRLGRAAAFLRTRLVLEADVDRGLGFEIGLNNELRWVIAPSGEKFQADEAIFDRLLVRWASPAGAPLVLTLGRQGLFFGDGFLVAEGTPLDETRSDYFNALRLDWTPAAGWRLTLFACHQTEKDAFLPVIRSRNRPLTEQPETGLGAVFGWKEERKEWEAAVIFKRAAAGSSTLLRSDILAFDGRAVLGLRRGISLSGEAAVQAGKKGGAGLFAWGASVRLDWEAEIAPLPPLRISAGGFALSGDDPASVRDEGWDPMFGRWPRWSESYIHTLALEYGGRTAWWSNLSCLYGEMDFLFKDRIGLRLAVRGLSAPRAGTDSWSMVSGEGRTRGILWSARVALRLSGNLRGHLLYENFRPGDYYLPSADGYSFLRFELLWLY